MLLILTATTLIFTSSQTSDTHVILVDILEKNNFVTQEFILSPLLFGLPYSRPRYYCLKKTENRTPSLQDLSLRYFTPREEKTENRTPSLQDPSLRYFTLREVVNLHSFPEDFAFPQHISLRQRYAMLGNSLSVGVVAPLLQYLFINHS